MPTVNFQPSFLRNTRRNFTHQVKKKKIKNNFESATCIEKQTIM